MQFLEVFAMRVSEAPNWNIRVKVFKNGPSKISGKQPLKRLSSPNFTWSILKYLDPFVLQLLTIVRSNDRSQQ